MGIENMAGAIGAGAAVALTPLLARLLRRIKWLRHEPREPLTPEQKRRCQQLQLAWLAPLFISCAAATWVLVNLFRKCAEWMRPSFGPDDITLDMSMLGWLVMAMFPAFCIGPLFLMPLARLIHGDTQYRIMWEYANTQAGLNQVRGTAVFLLTCLAADIALLPLASGYYVRINHSEIAFNKFLRFHEEIVPLDSIVQMRRVTSFKAPAGNIVRKPYFEITFTDHEPWLTKDWILGDLQGTRTKAAIDQIARITGKQIELYDPFPQATNH